MLSLWISLARCSTATGQQDAKVKGQKCVLCGGRALLLWPETLLPFDFCLLTFDLPFYSMMRPLRIPRETASVRLVAFSLVMIDAT
jgi:hypothetical protein